ncbi:13395_t:CDS:2, partial [Funneliformis geosporum]
MSVITIFECHTSTGDIPYKSASENRSQLSGGVFDRRDGTECIGSPIHGESHIYSSENCEILFRDINLGEENEKRESGDVLNQQTGGKRTMATMFLNVSIEKEFKNFDQALGIVPNSKGVNESSCNDPLIVVEKIMSDSDCSRVATSLCLELQNSLTRVLLFLGEYSEIVSKESKARVTWDVLDDGTVFELEK